MKKVSYLVTRIIYTPEEKEIVKTWGSDWKKMTRDGAIPIIFGEWSGYESRQKRIVHCDLGRKYFDVRQLNQIIVDSGFGLGGKPIKQLFTHNFSDNTTMDVWIEFIPFQEILKRELRRNSGYDSIIREGIKKTTV